MNVQGSERGRQKWVKSGQTGVEEEEEINTGRYKRRRRKRSKEKKVRRGVLRRAYGRAGGRASAADSAEGVSCSWVGGGALGRGRGGI